LSTTGRAEAPPDIYFLPQYGRAAAIADRGTWLNIEAHGGAWRMPLIVRTLSDGGLDAITPAFSGIYASTSLLPEQIGEAWSTTLDHLRRLGLISVVVRGSPLVPQAQGLPELRSVSSGRPTVVLDLTDETSAWDGLKKSCRSQVRKALRNGYTSEVRPAVLADLLPGAAFRRLYESTMKRRAADALYFFDDTYYAALLESLGADLVLTEVRGREGDVVSSTLLMRHGQRLHSHLTGSVPDDARMGSNNLMTWSAIQFAVEQGLSQFHLGAGVAGRDSILRFKSTFGGRELHYDVSGLILDEEAYGNQVRSRAEEIGVPVDALINSGFFPAYRAAAPAVSA
jgi:hypothetical protein